MSQKIPQQINLNVALITGTGTVTGTAIAQLDTGAYSGTPTYWFEAVFNGAASNTGTIKLRDLTSGTNIASINGATSTAYGIARVQFTPTAGAREYTVQIVGDGSRTQNVTAARILVLQDEARITETETQIEIGNATGALTNTAAADVSGGKWWKYNAASWDGTLSFFVEVVFKTSSTNTCFVTLCRTSDSAVNATPVNGVSSTSYTRVRIAFTPVDGETYKIRTRTNTSAQNYQIGSAKIIVVQSTATPFTELELNHLLLCTTDNNVVGLQNMLMTWNAGEWDAGGGTIDYKLAMDSNQATNSIKLYNVTDADDVTSTVTGTGQPLSASLTIGAGELVSGKVYDIWALNTTGIIASGRLIATYVYVATGPTGDLNVTLGAATVAATGLAAIVGTSTPTLGVLTTTATAKAATVATTTATLGVLASTANGTAAIAGTSTPTLGALTLTATGTVVSLGVNGTLNVTLGALTLTGTGQNANPATAAITLGTLAGTATGTAAILGTGIPTLGAVAITANGTAVFPVRIGSLNVTLGALALTGTGAAAAVGTASLSLGVLTFTGTGKTATGATFSQTLGVATLTGTGKAATTGTASNTLGVVTAIATGGARVTGTASNTLGGIALDGQGGSPRINGDANITLGTLTEAGTGKVAIAGASNPVFGSLTFTSTGTAVVLGSAANTLGEVTVTATATVRIAGAGVTAFGALTLTSNGLVLAVREGTLNVTLDGAALLATGWIERDLQLSPLTCTSDGSVSVSGELDTTVGPAAIAPAFVFVPPINVRCPTGSSLSATVTSSSLTTTSAGSTLQIIPRNANLEELTCSSLSSETTLRFGSQTSQRSTASRSRQRNLLVAR